MWFNQNFGFKETDYHETKSKFSVATNKNDEITLTSIPTGKEFFVGCFELPSVRELRERLQDLSNHSDIKLGVSSDDVSEEQEQEDIVKSEGFTFQNIGGNDGTFKPSKESSKFPGGVSSDVVSEEQEQEDIVKSEGLTFQNIGGNARSLHLDPENNGCVFQVASQFNCLEMVGPNIRPEDGVTRYFSDKTQGPACAISCPAGTVFRNYFVNGTGQGGQRQLDGAKDIAEFCDNQKKRFWEMRNGYLMPCRRESMSELTTLLEQQEFHDEVVSRLRVGVHWSTETETRQKKSPPLPPHRVCQVFSSATPVSYGKLCRPRDWAAFATTILEATFEATLAVAAIIAEREERRVKVFLTSVGAGAFGNSTIWLERALRRALVIHASSPIDVKLVHYGTPPANKDNKFRVLEKSWRRRRRNERKSTCSTTCTCSTITTCTCSGHDSGGSEVGESKK